MKAFILTVGVAILSIGIGVGTHRLSAAEYGSTVSCGTAYSPQSRDAYAQDTKNAMVGPRRTDLESACENMSATWKVVAYAVTGFGAAVLLGGLLVRTFRE
ncbi:hypothetical protein [Mycobacterium camsae]|uniref:hypothetical protein n=1 Tax=Mycobacterium gordonae TaxID=1778 RepID=UPI0019822357|nr:hypothetical protein [Mycobacterium gordonae]